MNKLILTAIRCSLMFLVPTVTYAISAQWDLDPISGDWNTAANWTPMGVPNGPADIARFGLSHGTDVSISADTEVSGITFTSAATNPYIIASPGLALTISGVGIKNNSGTTQTFEIAENTSENLFGRLVFSNRSTAGSANIFNERGGTTVFLNSSTAGNASIFAPIFSGGVTFLDHSTAGSAFIVNSDNSSVQFGDSSTAGSATIFSEGEVSFFSSSKGGTAQIELLTGAVAIGDSFVFLKYASVTDGGFQILNPVFNHGTEQWSVAYLRNRAILTVEQHAPGVPDQGSTFLLLTLGLLGLVMYRRQLLRGQP